MGLSFTFWHWHGAVLATKYYDDDDYYYDDNDHEEDLYIIGAVCLYVCYEKAESPYSKDLVVSPVYRHFPKVNSQFDY